jgi:hypothetical protein
MDVNDTTQRVTDIQTVLPAQISYCPIVMGLKEKVMDIRSHWMFFVASDPIILRGFLLVACRHLSLVELQDNYADMAIRYKLSYLQGLQECMFINKPSSRREAVSMTIVLAFDEVSQLPYRASGREILMSTGHMWRPFVGCEACIRSYQHDRCGRRYRGSRVKRGGSVHPLQSPIREETGGSQYGPVSYDKVSDT